MLPHWDALLPGSDKVTAKYQIFTELTLQERMKIIKTFLYASPNRDASQWQPRQDI